MGKIISISNQKGGVTKTTTTGALLEGLKLRGYKVLGIDLDPQGNLSGGVGADKENDTILEVLKHSVTATGAVQKLDVFDIIPSTLSLAAAETEINDIGNMLRLKKILDKLREAYDFIAIDTPPNLGFLTVSAFIASDLLIIPSTPSSYSADGIVKLSETIEQVREHFNPKLCISGILLTRLKHNTKVGKDIKEITAKIGEFINAPMFQVNIRESVVIEEAQASQKGVFAYNSSAAVVQDYNDFVEEFLKQEAL